MGIKNLMKLLRDEAPSAVREIKLKDLKDRRIAIDASTQLYQYFVMIRTSGNSSYDGFNSMLTSIDGRVTSHIQGFFNRTIKLLEMGIRPVYVFDGKPPELKQNELKKRGSAKQKAREEIETLKTSLETGIAEEFKPKLETVNENGELTQEPEQQLDPQIEQEIRDKINQLDKRTVRVTKEHNEEIKRLLRMMGVPVIEAPGEAEATCSRLARAGLVYAAGTEDMDALTFETPLLIRKLTFSGNKPIEEINLKKVIEGLKLENQEQFIDLCILCGCDYAPSIKGVGPKKAYALIKKHKNLEAVFEHVKTKTRYDVPEELESNLDEVRNLFYNPEVTDMETTKIKFEKPNIVKIKEFLVDELTFNKERVDKGIDKLLKYGGKKDIQQSITSFFKAG